MNPPTELSTAEKDPKFDALNKSDDGHPIGQMIEWEAEGEKRDVCIVPGNHGSGPV
jgi:hypothetical protein